MPRFADGLSAFGPPIRVATFVMLGALLVASGCGNTTRKVAVYPVQGEVKFDGAPATGAFVVFHPKGTPDPEVPRPRAQVQSDGSFKLTTFDENDGAPSGEYAVTVEWRKLVTEGGDVHAGPDVIPKPYGKAESTPLKVSIQSGANALPAFDIKK